MGTARTTRLPTAPRDGRLGMACGVLLLCLLPLPAPAWTLTGDRIEAPLTATPGDAARGREVVANRSDGLCLLCHAAPLGAATLQGDIAPDLAGVGSRLSAAQLRARLVAPRQISPQSKMPAYLQTENLINLPNSLRGKPLLNAQQIEDVVAYLATLKTP